MEVDTTSPRYFRKIICNNWDITKENKSDIRLIIAQSLIKNHNQILGLIPTDMGCQLFFKYNQESKNIYAFGMHSDSWGQYGETKDLHLLKEFIPDNYPNYKIVNIENDTLIYIKNYGEKSTKNIDCPICRKTSTIDFENYKKIYFSLPDGVQDPQCCVCDVATVSIYLHECGHTVLCESCAKKIGK